MYVNLLSTFWCFCGLFWRYTSVFLFVAVSFQLVQVYSSTILAHSVSLRRHSGSFRYIPAYSGLFRSVPFHSVPVFSNAQNILASFTFCFLSMKLLPSFYRNRSSQACPLFHYLVKFFFIFEGYGQSFTKPQNQIGFFVLFFLFAESVIAVDKRFIACVLASAFLCCLPPPPPDALMRSLNFNNFFACFHRYGFKEAFLGLV